MDIQTTHRTVAHDTADGTGDGAHRVDLQQSPPPLPSPASSPLSPPPPPTTDRASTILNTMWFGFAYVVMSTVQSFYNKEVFSLGFTFPISLCFTQMIGIIGFLYAWRSILAMWVRYRRGYRTQFRVPFSLHRWRDKARVLAPISFCFSLNLVLANSSLYVVDMNIFIVVRATTIVWIALFSRLILGERISMGRMVACAVVFCGSLAVGWSFTSTQTPREGESASVFVRLMGLAALVASTVINGVMCVLMKKVLTAIKAGQQAHKDSLARSPVMGAVPEAPLFEKYDFLFYQSLDAGLFLIVGVLLREASDLAPVLAGHDPNTTPLSVLAVLGMSSILTVIYQMSLIGLVSSTTPLGKEIISQTKVVPQVIFSIIVFDEHISVLSTAGLVLTVMGVFLYSLVSNAEGRAAARAARAQQSRTSRV